MKYLCIYINPKIIKMKKLSLLMITLIISIASYSQSANEEVDFVQAAFGMEKKAVVSEFIQLSDAQNQAFWDLYDQYETTRKENGKKRVALLLQYAEQYNTMTDEQADAWTKEVIKLQTATDKLIVTYYNKIKKATSATVATQFYQIENYILTEIRMEILENVPFLGEM